MKGGQKIFLGVFVVVAFAAVFYVASDINLSPSGKKFLVRQPLFEHIGGGSGSGCIPETCESLGNHECGDWDNGCGGTLNCGLCSKGESCDEVGYCVFTYPNAEFNFYPTNPSTGEEVIFRAEYEGDDIQLWQWSFSDGETGFGLKYLRKFDNSGTYSVTMKIYFDNGQILTHTKSLVVN